MQYLELQSVALLLGIYIDFNKSLIKWFYILKVNYLFSGLVYGMASGSIKDFTLTFTDCLLFGAIISATDPG